VSSPLAAERRMIPRWRASADAIESGELSHVGETKSIHPMARNPLDASGTMRLAAKSLSALIDDWRRTSVFGFAADLVSAASVISPDSTQLLYVRDAAQFLTRHGDTSRPLRRIATRLQEAQEVEAPDRDLETVSAEGHNASTEKTNISALDPLRLAVREHRHAVAVYPYDPLRWIDLSRAYLITGNRRASERAMRTALGLAPEHRFVLRSATRLFIHLGRRAPHLSAEIWSRLRRSAVCRSDPWLVAAEIATAMVLNESPRFVKSARSMIEAENFSPFQLSEVAGALASLEIDSGAIKRGRKLFDQALREPTENTVAQVAWTAQHLASDLHDNIGYLTVTSHEAQAWDDYRTGRWNSFVQATMRWHADEPFSTRPLLMGSFVAGGPLEDFKLSIQIAQSALKTDPDDAGVRNNLAFAYASLGNVSTAADVMSRLRAANLSAEERIASIATWGLIAFRRKDIEEGRSLYEQAIDLAKRQKDHEMETLATIYLAREMLMARVPDGNFVLEQGARLVKRNPRPYLRSVMLQVELAGATLDR
jgi:tetratricopeptide (TPR) repeat protein